MSKTNGNCHDSSCATDSHWCGFISNCRIITQLSITIKPPTEHCAIKFKCQGVKIAACYRILNWINTDKNSLFDTRVLNTAGGNSHHPTKTAVGRSIRNCIARCPRERPDCPSLELPSDCGVKCSSSAKACRQQTAGVFAQGNLGSTKGD